MAEVAALANLAGVAFGGVKLSLFLYEFASSLGSAGREIKTLGTDIALFCSVLKQVKLTLAGAKSFRVSTNAIQTTQDILNRSTEIFDEISAIFRRLQRDDSTPVDVLCRIKWTFKRAKVLLLQESLRSCTVMLHLMLTTMSFAQKIATIGVLTPEAEAEAEEERAMTQSLFFAQQLSNERLEELEEECLDEEINSQQSILTLIAGQQEFSPPASPVELKKFVHSKDVELQEDCLSTRSSTSTKKRHKRTSTILNSHLYQLDDCKESKRMTWISISDDRSSILQSNSLLRNWTDQCDPLAWDDGHGEDTASLIERRTSENREWSQNRPRSDSTVTVERGFTDSGFWSDIRPVRSPEAEDRSRQKIARLTGEMSIPGGEAFDITDLRVIPSPEPPESAKPGKKSKQLRWGGSRSPDLDVNREIKQRLRATGLV